LFLYKSNNRQAGGNEREREIEREKERKRVNSGATSCF